MDFREPWNFKSLRQVSESHPRSVFEAFNLRRLNVANFINISVSLTKIFFFLKISMGGFKDDRKGQTSNWSYRQSDTTRWSSTPKNNNEKKFLNSRIYQKMLFFELENSNWGAVCWRPLWPKLIFFVINRFN